MLQPGRIAAIVLIFFATSVAWAILGATILARTYEADSRLKMSVASTWGTPLTQKPPSAYRKVQRPERVVSKKDGLEIVEIRQKTHRLPLPSRR